MRHALLLFVLGCAVLGSGVASTINNDMGVPHVFNGTNYVNYTSTTTEGSGYALVDGVECDNTINGVATSATDVGDGTITVRGCGNKISNVTTATGAPANVSIYGFNNDVENVVVKAAEHEGMGMMPSVILGSASGNTVMDDAAEYIFMNDATDNVVTGNSAGGALWIASSSNNTVAGNAAASDITLSSDAVENLLVNNKAANIQLKYAYHADVESNVADYDLDALYINSELNPNDGNTPSATGNMAFDVAPVIAGCGSAFDETTSDGAGVTCTVTLPPGHMLSAGTHSRIPGASCTGYTMLTMVDSDDNVLDSFPNARHRRSLFDVTPPCSFAHSFNDGEESLDITINSSCDAMGQQTVPPCNGTTMYSITGFKTTIIKHNTANSIQVMTATSDVVESNTADYDLVIGGAGDPGVVGVKGAMVTNNTAVNIQLNMERNDATYHMDVFDNNHLDVNLSVTSSTNLSVIGNTGAHLQICSTCASQQIVSRLCTLLRSEQHAFL